MPPVLNPSLSASAFVTLDAVAARTPDGSPLFHDLTLAFGRERTGIVGRNGADKTTLLDLIEGTVSPARGSVSQFGSIARLPQTAPTGVSVAKALGVFAGLATLGRIMAGAGTQSDFADADWTLEARIDAALNDVGLPGLDPGRSVDSLSGGERTRLAVAGLLLAAPDLILLDEPTNHLDADGRRLISDILSRWPGGAVVVSHDRSLLDGMDRILDLEGGRPRLYGGGWELYRAQKEAETAAAQRDLAHAEQRAAGAAREAQAARERQARRDRVGRLSRRGSSDPKILLDARAQRAEATGARLGRLSARRVDQAEASLAGARERIIPTADLAMEFPRTGLPSGRTVLKLEAAEVALGANRRIGPFDLTMVGPGRIAVSGLNGSGKSTLLRVLAGLQPPSDGWVERPVEAILLDQDLELLRPDETVLAAYQRLNPDNTPNQAQAALARFLFRNTAALKRVGELSGGERLRAALACVMTGASPPQLLILDEPTNHLDLTSLEAVETALAAYDGALIVVSHDNVFLDAIGIETELRL